VTDPPSVVRVRPAPSIDPAFGDDLAEGTPAEGTAGRCPGQIPMPPQLWSAAAGRAGCDRGEPSTRPATGGDAQVAACRFVDVCAEVLNGYRPIAHLRPHTSPVDFATVVDHLTRRAVRVHMSSGAGGRGGRARVAVRRVRVCEPRTGVAEVAAVLDQRDGSWAMAVRLERRRERWTCTSLQVI
jgi:Family of unknown function (DUF6459)